MINGVRVRCSTVELSPTRSHPRYAGDRVNINSRTNRDGTVPSFLWALFPDWPEGVVENVVRHVIRLSGLRGALQNGVLIPCRFTPVRATVGCRFAILCSPWCRRIPLAIERQATAAQF